MKRGKFSLSHYRLFSCDMGELVPCGLVEVLPGDTVQHATSALVRCSPMLAPVMHPVHVRIHHWFVPHRLVWEEWEAFITGGEDGMQTPDFPIIELADSDHAVGTLADYLGVPTTGTVTTSIPVSALPFRAYNLIWNEWYRDQDLQTKLTVDVTSGTDTTTDTDLQNVAWEKDYFTSARPWEAKGPQITVPLGTSAPVTGLGVPNSTFGTSGAVVETGNVSTNYAFAKNIDAGAGTSQVWMKGSAASGGVPEVYADLSAATAVSINVLREALALQRFEEARARYGSRYTEYLRYLGVRSSDARLQRPEYLGGGRQTIQFSEVLQTSAAPTPAQDDTLGQLGGHGIGAMRSNRYRRFFEEHGYVISLMSIKPKTMYKDGLHRTWNRRVKEDFWQKELQHIGQQEILNKEIYADLAAGTGAGQSDATFGFQDRYDEYRRMESGIAGEFRTTLNYWHFARSFGALPTLNGDFIKSVPADTPFAVPATDVMWIMANHSIQARRLVAQVGTSSTF